MTKTNAQQALYRFYSDAGHLLYVGITSDPGRRFGQHSATKAWWPEVRGITLEWYADRDDVEHAERRAIRVEKPIWNAQRAAMRPPPQTRPCRYCKAPIEVYDLAPDEDPQEMCDMCNAIICDAYDAGLARGTRTHWRGRRNEDAVRRERGE